MHSHEAWTWRTEYRHVHKIHMLVVCVLVVQLMGGPTAAFARHWLRKEPAIQDLSGSMKRGGYSSWYQGCDDGGCACGIPAELLKDVRGHSIPYVALNFQNSGMSPTLSHQLGPTSEMGMFFNGRNCGRWIEITYQKRCGGGKSNVVGSLPTVCGVNALVGNPAVNYVADVHTGKKVYALVADSCSDNNYWCRNDVYHLSFSQSHVKGLCGSDTDCLNSRQMEWKFVDGAPAGLALPASPQFAWQCRARFPWYNPLLVYNAHHGVSSIMVEGVVLNRSTDSPQQFLVPARTMASSGGLPRRQSIQVEALDLHGHSYGKFEVPVDPSHLAKGCAGGKAAVKVSAGLPPELETQPVVPESIGKQATTAKLLSGTTQRDDLGSGIVWPSDHQDVNTLDAAPRHVDSAEIFESTTVVTGIAAATNHSDVTVMGTLSKSDSVGTRYKDACATSNLQHNGSVDIGSNKFETCAVAASTSHDAAIVTTDDVKDCQVTGADEGACNRDLYDTSKEPLHKTSEELDSMVQQPQPGHEQYVGFGTLLSAGPVCRPMWSQCGGKNYKGVQCCQGGTACRFVSQWYSQCQPIRS
eukprot:jgi/Ulvmu1/7505/UM037_0049.1